MSALAVNDQILSLSVAARKTRMAQPGSGKISTFKAVFAGSK
jgi:hypothetical protein